MAVSCDRIVSGLRQAGVDLDLIHLSRRHTKAKVEVRLRGRDLFWPMGEDAPHGLHALWQHLAEDPGTAGLTQVVAFGGVLPLVAAPIYAAWLDLPLITLLRGNDFDAGIFNPQRAGVVTRALERSARVVTVSREQAWKVSALGLSVDPMVIPNGIDLARWVPLPSEIERARQWRREAVAPGRRVLGLFGQAKAKKGSRFFLEALAASRLAARFHLLVVGDLSEGGAGAALGTAGQKDHAAAEVRGGAAATANDAAGEAGRAPVAGDPSGGAQTSVAEAPAAGLAAAGAAGGERRTEPGSLAPWLAAGGDAVPHTIEPHADRYQLLARYPACDLVVLPSFYDGMPNVLVEAMALGLPVLAARTGGMADLLGDGETGFLFAAGDAAGCRRALQRAAEASASQLAEMGAECRRRAQARLDHRQEVESYRTLLLATAGPRTARPRAAPPGFGE